MNTTVGQRACIPCLAQMQWRGFTVSVDHYNFGPHNPEAPYCSEYKGCSCKFSDAWRCANDQNLSGQVTCWCGCHRRRTLKTAKKG